MIHYTLLPNEERHALRREYRVRLAIVGLLFASLALVLGIFSLLPAYFYSYSEERDALIRQEDLRKIRKASGADQIEKDLLKTQDIAQIIIAEGRDLSYSNLVQKIVSHRGKETVLNSFDIVRAVSSTTDAEIIVQGKALTREGLLAFKKNLESDALFAGTELPLSDLAKSKNINFGMKVFVRKQN